MTMPVPAQPRLSLRKSESLRSRKILAEVAKKGRRISVSPFTLAWIRLPGIVPFVAAFTVPRKLVRKAVVRNRIKRRMREAYRKNKIMLQSLKSVEGIQTALLFIFTGREDAGHTDTESKILKILNRLAETIQSSRS
jgi:ribonuclease P protein component